MKTNLATLKLFNAIRVPEHRQGELAMLSETVSRGFVLDPSISQFATSDLIEEIGSYYLSTSKANQAFHKSWQTIKDTPQEELWMQAIIHYFTTYGYEELGISGEVYIPEEELNIPNGISLIKVIGLTDEELQGKILELGSGIALSEDTLEAVIAIIENQGYQIDVKTIKNRELKSALYDLYDIAPDEPIDYLRFVISRLTGKTLLIKSKTFFEAVTASDSQAQRRELDRLLLKSPDNLAEIFFRYKPLFLALKYVSSNKTFFNRLRKRADKTHRPLPVDYLNSVTGLIKHDKLDLGILEKKLEGTTVFRKIRLANALRYRLEHPQAVVYKVRNGRSWVDDFVTGDIRATEKALEVVMSTLKINKTVYVPKGIEYGLPATEKQFIGNFPANTKISVEDNLIVGVYWENVKSNRIDLDFSSVSLNGKIGWDSYYRSGDGEALFSGDMTDARNGASELFYFGENNKRNYALFLNYYNFDEDLPVTAKIFVAHEKPVNFRQNYVANNIILQADFTIKEKQTFIGLVYGNSLSLSASSIGKSISSGGVLAQKTREWLLCSTRSSLKINDVLNVVHEKGDYPDLSPEKLDKGSILHSADLLNNSRGLITRI